MVYTVQSGDSLWRIAWLQLGDPNRWSEIAGLNQVRTPDRLLVGQRLFLPALGTHSISPAHRGAPTASRITSHLNSGLSHPSNTGGSNQSFEKKTPLIPARAHLFFMIDEFNPFTKKLTRKVGLPKQPLTPEEAARILRPDIHGMSARLPGDTKVPIGRHVLGMNESRFISASDLPGGSPRLQGETFWIDVAKLKQAGVTLHDGTAIAKDLDRIAAKAKDPKFKAYIEDIRQKSLVVDREVLLEGSIPAAAVKGASAMRLTQGLRVVEGVGLVFSAYDLGKAGQESYNTHSVVPLAKESVRQAGGWAGAWAGAEIGGAGGAALGIETGPGAILTGAAGALIFGTAGFFGADWATKRIFGAKK
jgi:hypothetical protein